jgi:hypothetical protein
MVTTVLKSYKANTAAGPDGIPPRILQTCAVSLSCSLSTFFNLSLATGVVPSEWKNANVIPVFKSGSRSDPRKYRPISITSAVCKALEKKIISMTVHNYLNDSNQIPNNQHGVLPRRSCNTMHMFFIDEWQKHLETHAGGHIHAVSLNWEKAFDKIPHSRLISKLCNIGINGTLLKWFQRYLTNRKQRVTVNGLFSEWHNVTSGVVQGSVLGPLLFNIFMADLSLNISSRLVMYADDSTLFRSIHSYEDEVKLQEDLCNSEKWCHLNKMKINVSKCAFKNITLSKFRRFGRYSIGAQLIANTVNIKLLGLHIAYSLSWNFHSESVRSSVAKLLGFVNRNLKGCSPNVKQQSYLTLIRPILVFGAPVRHPTSQKNVNKFQLLQDRASRFIYGKTYTHKLDEIVMSHDEYLN